MNRIRFDKKDSSNKQTLPSMDSVVVSEVSSVVVVVVLFTLDVFPVEPVDGLVTKVTNVFVPSLFITIIVLVTDPLHLKKKHVRPIFVFNILNRTVFH